MEEHLQIVKLVILLIIEQFLVMQDTIMFLMSKLVVNVIIHGNILFKNAKLL